MNTCARTPHLLSVSCSLLLATSALAQGPLNPSGAPAATMKTLQQIEPRTDLQASSLPPGVTTDASYHFIINQPGSYYLSANLDVTKPNGIDVRAAGVTLDLNGFELRRTEGAGGHGIEVDVTSHRCQIRNGSIRGVAYGVRCILTSTQARGGSLRQIAVSGCSTTGAHTGEGWEVEGVKAHDNSGVGIHAGSGATLSNCTAYANGGAFGIQTDNSATLTNCNAYSNSQSGISTGGGSTLSNCAASANTQNGIATGSGSSLAHCAANGNTGNGINAGTSNNLSNCTAASNNGNYGIQTGAGSTLTNCTASDNNGVLYGIRAAFGSTLKNCTARGNNSTSTSVQGILVDQESSVIGCTATDNLGPDGSLNSGIHAKADSTVKDCTVQGNSGDGIFVTDNCQVIGNTANGNGTNASNNGGIRALGQANRIESNHVVDNDRGIQVDNTRNFIARNTARTNGDNYVIVAGNRIAQIVVVATNAADITGANSGSSDGFTNVDPWANFSF